MKASHLLPIGVLYALTLMVGLATRLALLAQGLQGVGGVGAVFSALVIGAGFDLIVATYFCVPLAVWLAVVRRRLARSRIHRGAMIAACGCYAFLLLLVAASEWVFWDEFGARFNFIAVDYLVYTREVLGNIMQSFPVGKVAAALAALAAVLAAAMARPLWRLTAEEAGPAFRAGVAACLLATAAAFTAWVSGESRPRFLPDVARELAGNGIYQFFSAFRQKSLDYPAFYATLPEAEARRLVMHKLTVAGERWPEKPGSPFEREVIAQGTEQRWNVVLVSMESLGSDYVGHLGDTCGLTPNLDRLARESLVFTGVFATGNRTVRDLEALSLSIPPTPGEAIIKRPGAVGLFTLGSIFRERGYDTLYVYGGYGYFDNMNDFFSSNGYRAVDRRSIARERIHHETIWGVADEDLFEMALDELDRADAAGKRFFARVMTTSNHRPYTYPPGRIDIPSGSGREGAVKYTDYALGRFLDVAKGRRWFERTLFVITADHGANARGTLEIPVEQYRIPLYFYAPAHIRAGQVDRLMSQIDIGPTVLGRLNFSYRSKFFGRDIFNAPASEDRAFVANYQTLGYLARGQLVSLAPQRATRVRPFGPPVDGGSNAERVRDEAIVWYQSAYRSYRAGEQRDDRSISRPVAAP